MAPEEESVGFWLQLLAEEFEMRRELEVMRVLRIPPLGKLVVEVAGKRVQKLSEINDEKAQRVLLAAVGELIDFAGGYQALVKVGVAPAQTGNSPSLPETPLAARQAEFLAQLEYERDALKKKPSPKRPLSVLGRAVGSEPTPPIKDVLDPINSELSVAGQIDAILQKYIAADSELAARSVHLIQDQAGGIGIEVDGRTYQQPSDIPDTHIQGLIKRAVKKWDAA